MNIAVYCGSLVTNIKPEWEEAAIAIGRWIGQHGASLIYGGVDMGLMKIVSTETKKSGGNVVGVVPMRRRDTASVNNDVEVPTSDLNERKGVMQLLADLFVVLPGGYGTLDEFTTSFSYINFTNHLDRTIILFNSGGIYDHLFKQLRVMVDNNLMSPRCMSVLRTVETTDELIAALDGIYAAVNARQPESTEH